MGLSSGQEEEQPVGPSPGHHRGSRGGEEEERRRGGEENQWVQVRGNTVAAGEKRRRSKPVGPSPGQEEEQPVCLSLGHHCGSRGEEEEEQTSGAESGAGRGATSGSKSGASPW